MSSTEHEPSAPAERQGAVPRVPVLFLTHYDRIGAPSRYRYYQYFDRFREAGLIPKVQFIQSARMYLMKERGPRTLAFVLLTAVAYLKRAMFLLFQGWRFPVWVVEKELFPLVPFFLERLFFPRRARIVVDYDDAVFLKYDVGSGMKRVLLANKIAKVMRRADAVFSGNEYISEYATRAGARRIEWVPSVVDEGKYRVEDGVAASGSVVIGWMGSYRNSRHIASIGGALQRLGETEKFVLRIVGGSRITLPAGIEVEYRPWSEEDEVAEIRQFSIGIMPLVDEGWEKGKCGLKLIQYLAAGVPVVASPVGINNRIVVPGVNGDLAATEDDWLAAFRRILKERASGEFSPKACIATVEDTFTVAAQSPKMIAVIRALAAGGGSRA
jgi:glycosyltransferase involved in cell wall biosynthesis